MCDRQSARYLRPGVRSLKVVIPGLILALGLPLRGTAWAQPVGSEFQVNTYTIGSQSRPAVAADADGDFLVVWHSYGQDGSNWGVFGRRYTSAGAAVGVEFQVNTYTTSVQAYPAVAADPDGDFVVVWRSYSQDGSQFGLFGQRYASAGAAVGAEFQVNTYTTSHQLFPAVAADADGGFVVVWDSFGQDGSDDGIFGRRYTSAGAAVGAEFQVNTYTTGTQGTPAVAAEADGDFVVVWGSALPDGGGSYGVLGQRYTSAGAAVGAEFQVNTYTTSLQFFPAVAAEADGDFVVVWTSEDVYPYGQDGSGGGIFGQRYTSAGAAVGAEFQVNTYTTGDQFVPAVALGADGDFVVVWTSEDVHPYGQDGSGGGIFGQRYTSAGAAVGAEFQVNTYTTGLQRFPVVATDADGDFVVVWHSYGQYGQDGSLSGVFGQRGQPTVPTTTTSTTTTSTTTTSTTTTSTSTTLPPSIPTLSSRGGLLLGVLLTLPMLWGFRRRVVGSSATLRK